MRCGPPTTSGPIDVVTATATATVTVPVLPPNIIVNPLAVSSNQQTNTQTQHTLTISNTGGSAPELADLRGAGHPGHAACGQPAAGRRRLAAQRRRWFLAGVGDAAPSVLAPPKPAARALAKRAITDTGLLLVPDSTNDQGDGTGPDHRQRDQH